jgi:hypothetical protein
MKKFLLVIGILCLMTTGAFATTITFPTTLDQLVALGPSKANGVVIDDKTFWDFTYSSSASGGAVAIPASGITVNEITTALNPGLQFNASWAAASGQTMDSLIGFKVQTNPGGGAINDSSATMVGAATAAGLATVVETLTLEPSTLLGSILLHADGTPVLSGTANFAATLGIIDVEKDIGVNGSIGTAAISSVTDQFSEVPIPIPPTALLLGSGLVGLLGLRRFRKQ